MALLSGRQTDFWIFIAHTRTWRLREPFWPQVVRSDYPRCASLLGRDRVEHVELRRPPAGKAAATMPNRIAAITKITICPYGIDNTSMPSFLSACWIAIPKAIPSTSPSTVPEQAITTDSSRTIRLS